MQQVQQPLQQEKPRQSPLQNGNQARKPLSKDEILNSVIRTEQDRPKYKPSAPMLSEANVKAAGPICAKLHAYVMVHSKDKLAFPAKVDQG
jgi:thiamine monophosphate synthase